MPSTTEPDIQDGFTFAPPPRRGQGNIVGSIQSGSRPHITTTQEPALATTLPNIFGPQDRSIVTDGIADEVSSSRTRRMPRPPSTQREDRVIARTEELQNHQHQSEKDMKCAERLDLLPSEAAKKTQDYHPRPQFSADGSRLEGNQDMKSVGERNIPSARKALGKPRMAFDLPVLERQSKPTFAPAPDAQNAGPHLQDTRSDNSSRLAKASLVLTEKTVKRLGKNLTSQDLYKEEHCKDDPKETSNHRIHDGPVESPDLLRVKTRKARRPTMSPATALDKEGPSSGGAVVRAAEIEPWNNGTEVTKFAENRMKQPSLTYRSTPHELTGVPFDGGMHALDSSMSSGELFHLMSQRWGQEQEQRTQVAMVLRERDLEIINLLQNNDLLTKHLDFSRLETSKERRSTELWQEKANVSQEKVKSFKMLVDEMANDHLNLQNQASKFKEDLQEVHQDRLALMHELIDARQKVQGAEVALEKDCDSRKCLTEASKKIEELEMTVAILRKELEDAARMLATERDWAAALKLNSQQAKDFHNGVKDNILDCKDDIGKQISALHKMIVDITPAVELKKSFERGLNTVEQYQEDNSSATEYMENMDKLVQFCLDGISESLSNISLSQSQILTSGASFESWLRHHLTSSINNDDDREYLHQQFAMLSSSHKMILNAFSHWEVKQGLQQDLSFLSNLSAAALPGVGSSMKPVTPHPSPLNRQQKMVLESPESRSPVSDHVLVVEQSKKPDRTSEQILTSLKDGEQDQRRSESVIYPQDNGQPCGMENDSISEDSQETILSPRGDQYSRTGLSKPLETPSTLLKGPEKNRCSKQCLEVECSSVSTRPSLIVLLKYAQKFKSNRRSNGNVDLGATNCDSVPARRGDVCSDSTPKTSEGVQVQTRQQERDSRGQKRSREHIPSRRGESRLKYCKIDTTFPSLDGDCRSQIDDPNGPSGSSIGHKLVSASIGSASVEASRTIMSSKSVVDQSKMYRAMALSPGDRPPYFHKEMLKVESQHAAGGHRILRSGKRLEANTTNHRDKSGRYAAKYPKSNVTKREMSPRLRMDKEGTHHGTGDASEADSRLPPLARFAGSRSPEI
ncbi:MAG: ATP-dependent RNA helicase [Chaenotheca gracillima]|nr:MAG: ATP-dependent RNA helicase [Chaenotheca gracillima]